MAFPYQGYRKALAILGQANAPARSVPCRVGRRLRTLMHMNAIMIVSTTPTQSLAESIADALIERRLAACVQVEGPIRSTFRWEGKVETCQEWRITIKTTADRFDEIEAAISELHEYDVPEILTIPVQGGHEPYLAWMQQQAT